MKHGGAFTFLQVFFYHNTNLQSPKRVSTLCWCADHLPPPRSEPALSATRLEPSRPPVSTTERPYLRRYRAGLEVVPEANPCVQRTVYNAPASTLQYNLA